MDNKNLALNISSNIIKPIPKSETRETQVFVLPPELLKGLLPKNKISKMTNTRTRSKSLNLNLCNEEFSSKCINTNSWKLKNMDNNREKVLKTKKSEKCDKIFGEERQNIPTPVERKKHEIDINNTLFQKYSADKQLMNSNKLKNISNDLVNNDRTNIKMSAITITKTNGHRINKDSEEVHIENQKTKRNLINISNNKEPHEGHSFITSKPQFDNEKDQDSQVHSNKCNAFLSDTIFNNIIHEDLFSETSLPIFEHGNKSNNEMNANKEDQSLKHNISTDDSDTKLNNSVNEKSYLENNSSTILNENIINEVSFQKRKRGRPPKLLNSINKTSEKCSNNRDCHIENKVAIVSTLSSEIDDSVILQKNKRRQLTVVPSSVESCKINSNEQEINNLNVNDSMNEMKEKCLRNENIHNEYSHEMVSASIHIPQAKEKRSKLELQIPSIFTDENDKKRIHETVKENSQTNFNKSYTMNEVCLENNDTNKNNMELYNTQKSEGRRNSTLIKNSKKESVNYDKCDYITVNRNINKFEIKNTDSLESTVINKELLDSLNVSKKISEKCVKSQITNHTISIDETKKKIIHEKVQNYSDLEDINKPNTINRQHLEYEDTCKEYLHEEVLVPYCVPKRRRGRPSKTKIPGPSISSKVVDKNITYDNAQSHSSVELNTDKFSNVNKDHLVHLDMQTSTISTQKRKRSLRFSINSNKVSNKTISESINEKNTKLMASSESSSYNLTPINIKDIIDGKGLSDDNCSISDDNEININHKRKRKYPFNVYEKRKRGRPKGAKGKNNCDDDYIPHHSQLCQSSKKGKSKPYSSVESNIKKMVICGKCNMEILKSQWPHHNLSLHNDLGWLKGTMKPDFENDEKLLKRVLFNAIKRRRGTLICEMCNVTKRSVLGFISHTTFCGKDEEEKQALMVTCPVCKAVTKPSSLEYHERMHKIQTEEKQKTNLLEMENTNVGPKIKRKAAEKAVSKISEFTALAKDDKDDKDNTFSLDKKLKLNYSSVKKLIQKPQVMKRIPGTLLGKWKKDLNIGESAICSQIGCQFNSKSLTEIKQHFLTCNFTPQENFLCKICQFQTLSKSEIVKHALQKHLTENNYDTNTSVSDTESFSNESNNEIDNVSKKNHGLLKKFRFKENIKSSNKMFKFLFKDDACHTKHNKPFFAAFQWTLEFEQKNYKFNLYREFVPNNFKLLSINESEKYLPEVEQSMLMKNEKTSNQDSKESEWKKWKRFEGRCIQDIPTFFVGGPVWALAWLPIPSLLSFSENISQFIAISTHPTMDIEFSVGKIYSGKNIIQIWNFGDLNNKMNEACDPKLAYAITHEGGTVWCLEWCPSGCYQHKELPNFINENGQFKRMGLLAAACSDGCIRIYSLIFPEDLPRTDYVKTSENNENIYPIYNTEPVLILIVNSEMYDKKQQTWQVTKLSWTKENEHNIIVAGFSNGYIALWDLTSKSPILKCKKGDTIFLNPYRHFFAHHHAITMVYLVPQDNKRFLATASLDRYYKFWDLENITNPRNFLKKSFVTDGAWLNNWCCALIAYDDALSMNHSYSYCVPLREYTYKYYNILPTNSTSYTISTSDFGNSIANGTLAGEVLAMFPQQLLYFRDMDKTLPRKRYTSMVSSLEVVDFQSESENTESGINKNREKKNDKAEYNYMPSNYNDSKDRFGLKFCDKMHLFRDECSSRHPKNKKILTCEMMKNVPIEQYPFMSVNRLSWNPNAWSFLWLAVGYQNGFVRLLPFTSLASTTEWNKLLISHIDKIKSENSVTKTAVINDDR